MVIENNPGARIHMVSRGEMLHPGTCMICGSGDPERTYLDVGVFFDYEGSMYICILCGTQIGETLGLFTPEEVNIQTEAIANLQAKVDSMEEELAHARPIMVGVRGLLDDLVRNSPVVATEQSESNTGDAQRESEVHPELHGGIPGVGEEGESTPKESTPVPDTSGVSFS